MTLEERKQELQALIEQVTPKSSYKEFEELEHYFGEYFEQLKKEKRQR